MISTTKFDQHELDARRGRRGRFLFIRRSDERVGVQEVPHDFWRELSRDFSRFSSFGKALAEIASLGGNATSLELFDVVLPAPHGVMVQVEGHGALFVLLDGEGRVGVDRRHFSLAGIYVDTARRRLDDVVCSLPLDA